MSIIEKKLSQGESFQAENNQTIIHFAIQNGKENDEIELTYNNGFNTILKIPQNNVLEINSEYITISEIKAVKLAKSPITIYIELNDKTAITQGYSEENYKIQYIKGERGETLQWDDLTDEQRQSLAFKIERTFYINKNDETGIEVDININESHQALIDKIIEKLSIKLNQLVDSPGFYLVQTENNFDNQTYVSELFYYKQATDDIEYIGRFSGAQGDKGDKGDTGPAPNLNKIVDITLAGGLFNPTSANASFSEFINDKNEKTYELSLNLPEYVYFGEDEQESSNYPFWIDTSDIESNNNNNNNYYIISGGTSFTVIPSQEDIQL